jgi:hypothetical protein
MKRSLAALTLALLLALVEIALLESVAVGAIVGSRFQAEDMIESSGNISPQSDPDGTGPAGRNLKWASGAGVADRARQDNIIVPTGSPPVDQIQLFTRQASSGQAVFAIYVDGTATANKVGTFSPPAGSVWGIRTVNLSTAIQPGTHTLYIGPNASFSNNAFIDWFELYSTGTPPPTDSDSDSVPDSTDQCPTQPGPASNNGCPVTPPPPPGAFNPGIGKGSATACTRTLSAGGNVETFINSLRPGERGCLRGGLYTADNSINVNVSGTSASPIILAAYPGERAEIRASFQAGSSANIELEGLYVDASYAPVKNINGRINTEQSVSMNSSNSWLFDSVELVNRRTPDNSGTCVFGGQSQNARFVGSWVHNCGDPVALDSSGEHGFYIANSTGMRIEHTWVSDVSDHCLKFSQAVSSATARGVVCDTRDKAVSVYFNGTTRGSSLENSVVRGQKTVWKASGYSGSNNRVIDNCLSPSGPVDLNSTFTVSGNVVVPDPGISGFKVTNPTCAAKLPADSPFRP